MSSEHFRLVLIIVVLTLASGFADSQGFVHAARIWQDGALVWGELAKSALGLGTGTMLYWLLLRFLKELGVSAPEIQTGAWFAATLIGVALASGKFFHWRTVDQLVALVVLLGIGWLLVRTESGEQAGIPEVALAAAPKAAVVAQPTHFYLDITESGGPTRRQVIAAQTGKLVIGRGDNSHVRLTDKRVSRVHLVVSQRARQFTLTDACTANGTLLDGCPLDANQPTPWKLGASVVIGDTHLTLGVDNQRS
jgi:hypothetical protein